MIELETLGPIRVSVDERAAPSELLWRKHLALLVYLARSPKRTRTRAHLIALLWPDKDAGAARHSLNEALRVIRKATPTGLESDAEQVTIAADAVRLDLDELERRLGEGDWPVAARLVLGEFLEGFELAGAPEFERWLANERHQWNRRSVEALTQLADQQLGRGELTEGLESAQRAARIDPWSEGAISRVMRALALLGHRADALARFEAFASTLTSELGVGVSNELSVLAARIKAQGGGPRRATLAAEDRLRRAPLVGRAAALADLDASWRRASTGGGREVAVIRGLPGHGRSRLLEESAARLALEGAVVLRIRAVPSDRSDPLSGIIALVSAGLAAAPGVAATAPPAVAALAQAAPSWAERFPNAAAPVGEWSLARSFGEAVTMVAAERPVAILIDDAQWLDDDSLAALESLARRGGESPIWIALAVATGSETPALDRIASQLGRDLRGVTVNADALGPAPIGELVRWAFPSYRPDEAERLARRLATDSAGVPLLAIELLNAIAGGMEPGAAAWPAPLRTLDQSLPGDLPSELVAAFRVSFRRLSEGAQAALAALSVLGDRVDERTVAAVAELDLSTARAALDELEWTRWIEAEPRGYGFVARIAKLVVREDMLTAGQRRRLEAMALAR